MNHEPQTLGHPFAISGNHDVLEAAAGVPIHESLDAATDRLEAVIAGLRELMQEPTVTQLATLTFYACESALALVYSAHAGVVPEQGGAA